MSISELTAINNFYDRWNIQCFVLLSLSLQTILILFAPMRKRTRNVMVMFLNLLVYLVADWAVNVAVGLITYNQKLIRDHHVDIVAFWAPFLLLHHLPEQDNAGLWQRQFVGFLSRVVNAFTIFHQSLPKNKLWLPTILLFVAGTIKYGERTYALFCANLNKFKESMLHAPDPGPNYAKLMDEYSSKVEANLPTHIELIPEPNKYSRAARFVRDIPSENQVPLNDLDAVKYAYHFFQKFKGLIVDLILSIHNRNESRQFFCHCESEDAFKVIAIELNFMYEVFYMKAVVVHFPFLHLVVRFISWCAVVLAFSIFCKIDKHDFGKIDVEITYILFIGAIWLDIIAVFMLAFSDWTVASIQKLSRDNILKAPIDTCFCPLLKYFLTLKKINWGTYTDSTDTESTSCLEWAKKCLTSIIHPKKCLEQAIKFLFRRWGESLYAYNLIDYCLKELDHEPFYSRRILSEKLGLKDYYDAMKYVSKIPFTKNLWDFIFDQLKRKSKLVDDPNIAKRICLARGDWVLQDSDWNSCSSKLMSYVVDVDYDQSLIIWHIATEICYNADRADLFNSNDSKFCKTLSDYMLYLLVMQPTMMSAVSGIGQIRFRDTCAEAKTFFTKKDLGQVRPKDKHIWACEMILKVKTNVEPVAVKGDKCKSVLFDACILAKELGKFERQKRWKLMSEVWVELLSYAASHCRAKAHVTQLSEGGELITFVWLLMAHFGIGDQFQVNEGHPRAKLLVGTWGPNQMLQISFRFKKMDWDPLRTAILSILTIVLERTV